MAAKENANKELKTLIVYYSKTGNTHTIATYIHDLTSGDMVELIPVDSYPGDYTATTQQAKRELESGYRPPLTTKIDAIGTYDLVFVGSPNWWSTVAGPVKTFLTSYDLSGKILAPFITHEGSGLAQIVTDIEKWCPKSAVTKGLAIRGHKVVSAQGDVAAWLRSIGLSQ